ncbi:Phytochrome-like protein cph1 [Anaerohalosphaera lusitana]|uniref:histidine kinase n=1 Tax=Anaerohalosphaera lusitana TaxID=1936003 RepID=A0A1U9NQB0_9BACT|nr:ATP-binding protein [Anaerohalosphaera lusitana]AQT69908.1 Phytochrome-like protein cph1 [Anaerohalosphaera lusitana]
MSTPKKVFLLSVLGGLGFWVFDSVVDLLIFEDLSFLQIFISDVPGHEIYVRIFVLMISCLYGLIVARLVYAREENEENTRATLNSIGDAVIATDAQGCVVRMNPIAESLTGWKLGEAKGRPLQEVFHIINAKSREVCKNPVEKVLATGQIVGLANHTALIAKDGREYQIADSAAPVVLSDGKTAGVVLVFRDVTEEYEIREKLAVSEKRFRELFENSINAYALHEIVLDDKGEPVDYVFLEVNKSFERLTGLVGAETIGKRVTEVVPGVENGPFIRRFGQVAMTGEPTRFEEYDPNLGRWFDIAAYCPQKGQFVAVFTDITVRKQAEQAREELVRELEMKNEELESLVYVASHDLRSPLVNISGFSHELERTVEELDEKLNDIGGPEEFNAQSIDDIHKLLREDAKESVGYITGGVEQMDMLLKGLLRLSRVGRTELKIENVNMNGLLGEVAEGVAYLVQENDVRLTVGEVPGCRGDHVQLSQVFTNLIDNAIKYRDRDGKRCEIEISGEVQDGGCLYKVCDNGIGIQREHQQKIFELFHRLEPGGLVEGQGLGLTIVRRVINRLGGRVWLESEPGEGTCFYIELPASVI